MKKLAFATLICLFLIGHSWALTYSFSGSHESGTGSAVMEISIIGNTLSLALQNTSPLALDDNSGGDNAPGIAGFGFFLENLVDYSSWSLIAHTIAGDPVQLGGTSEDLALWGLMDGQAGASPDYHAASQGGSQYALYNPLQRDGLAANAYFTTAYFDMISRTTSPWRQMTSSSPTTMTPRTASPMCAFKTSAKMAKEALSCLEFFRKRTKAAAA
ncbi:hypothetical protein [Geoalkalibacter ferrihydriticus]|uniref:hypothetical protein n=1 Tax=Geoalkalibacter ferrihydriticus TaxID=392333 RepID=UPI00190FA352|nr:hypothetical protein [Geoalkalibacter ferrihydriticus]